MSKDNQPQPEIAISKQFIKELSFENPGGAKSFSDHENPNLNVEFDLTTEKLGDHTYEVAIKTNCTFSSKDSTLFALELVYAGIFDIHNFPAEVFEFILNGECPRQLFPFVRKIILDITADSGFPPLNLDPFNFANNRNA